MNWKAILIIAILTMGMGLSSSQKVSAADTFSGFVDDYSNRDTLNNFFSMWSLEQYDLTGQKVNTSWMSYNETINITSTMHNRIVYKYGQCVQNWPKSYIHTSLTLNIYNYCGGEIKIMPVQTNEYPTDWNIYFLGKFYRTVHADADRSPETEIDIDLTFAYPFFPHP